MPVLWSSKLAAPDHDRSPLLGYVALGILYVLLMLVLGLKTVRNGRWVLFVLGFVFPVLWIIGGVLPPKGRSRVDALYEER
jgi:hypothetical protein